MLILQIDKQAEYFLKSFVKEFEGRAPEILEMAEEFKAYLPDDTDAAAATALEHFQAHGEGHSVVLPLTIAGAEMPVRTTHFCFCNSPLQCSLSGAERSDIVGARTS